MTYLKIENPGVCPVEGFTLLGATSKRLIDNSNPYTIGQFGSGNKHALGVLLRFKLFPIVYCSNHKLEFTTKPGKMQALEGSTAYNRVVVKHGGKDEDGSSCTSTEELSQTDEYGAIDWTNVGMALREFVSNAIDAAIAVSGDWRGVKVELVQDDKVRAKRGFTRVFVPADNEDVVRFFANLGKWFLHFSEPDNILNSVLTKRSRNLEANCQGSVVYRRGVRVREITRWEGLFDYNLNDLHVDESRNVDDYACRTAAAAALAQAGPEHLATWMKSFREDRPMWEHQFSHYEMQPAWGERMESITARKANWKAAVGMIGDNVVLTSSEGPRHALASKGYTPITVPETIVDAAQAYGCPTPLTVLSRNELDGRETFAANVDAIAALDWVWDQVVQTGMDDGKVKPPIQCFRSVMNGGAVVNGFYRDGTVYLNEDISNGASVELRQTTLEEVAHYLTGSKDETRDLQDFAFKFAVRIAQRSEVYA